MPEEEYMVYLRSKLCGGLSEIYSEMRLEEAKDYQLLKERVRERYDLTPKHSRRELRILKKRHELSLAAD